MRFPLLARRVPSALILCIICLLCCLHAAAASGTRLIYVSDGDGGFGQFDVYSRDLDTGAVTQLTDNAAIDNHPTVSPDGQWLVVSSTRGTGEFNIFLGDLDDFENTVRQLTFFENPNGPQTEYPSRHPHFHPSNPRILVFSSKNLPLEHPVETISECSVPRIVAEPPRYYEQLNILELDGDGFPVTTHQLDLRDAWNQAAQPDIWTANTSIYAGHPSFSPDGSKIIFSGSIDGEGNEWEVYSVGINPATWTPIPNSLRRHTDGPAVGPNPIQMSGGAKYSKDGAEILFSSTRTPMGNSQIFSIPADAVDVPVMAATQRTAHQGNDYVPHPQPDGSFLVVTDEGGSRLDIGRVGADGSRENLTDNPAADEMLLIGDEVSWFCGLKPNLSAVENHPRVFTIENLWLTQSAWKFLRGYIPGAPIPDDLLQRFGYPDQAARMYGLAWERLQTDMQAAHPDWETIEMEIGYLWWYYFDVMERYPPTGDTSFLGLFPDEEAFQEWRESSKWYRRKKYVLKLDMPEDRGIGVPWKPWVCDWTNPDPFPADFSDPQNWRLDPPGREPSDVARFHGPTIGDGLGPADTVVVRVPTNVPPAGIGTVEIELVQLQLQSVDPIVPAPLNVSSNVTVAPGAGLTVSNLFLSVTNAAGTAELRIESNGVFRVDESVGEIGIMELGGEAWMFDSFFDVFTELSIDGGGSLRVEGGELRVTNVMGTARFLIGSNAVVNASNSVIRADNIITENSGEFIFQYLDLTVNDTFEIRGPSARVSVTGGTGEVGRLRVGGGGGGSGGAIHLDYAVIVSDEVEIREDGELRGRGTVTVTDDELPVFVHGRISPGRSTGILTIDGALNFYDTATLDIEIGGATAGDKYDRLAVTGHANLSGTLVVTLLDGFESAADDAFTFLTYGSHSNAFATLDLPEPPDGLVWHIAYGTTGAVLRALSRDGDFDGDGIPNGWEYDHFGSVDGADADAPAANGVNTIRETYIAGLDPNNPSDRFEILVIDPGPPSALALDATLTDRIYDVEWTTNLLVKPILWTPYGLDRSGTDGPLSLPVTNTVPARFHRARVRLPETEP